jgi:hypothetical protein
VPWVGIEPRLAVACQVRACRAVGLGAVGQRRATRACSISSRKSHVVLGVGAVQVHAGTPLGPLPQCLQPTLDWRARLPFASDRNIHE